MKYSKRKYRDKEVVVEEIASIEKTIKVEQEEGILKKLTKLFKGKK